MGVTTRLSVYLEVKYITSFICCDDIVLDFIVGWGNDGCNNKT